jgi:hypothetical protein
MKLIASKQIEFYHFVFDKEVKKHGVTSDEIHESHWIVALVAPNQLERVNEDQSKLSDLEEGVERFPPEEKLLCSWKSCGENEVSVDDDMNGSVDESEER